MIMSIDWRKLGDKKIVEKEWWWETADGHLITWAESESYSAQMFLKAKLKRQQYEKV
jgi:hypothetical protein